MKLDVFLTPGELSNSDVVDRTVVVIDILRASTTIVEALSAGAKSIYPVSSIEEALRLANTFGRDEVLLCGERKCLPIEGFDLGNSPREFTAESVAGKTLVMSTTNGTNVMSLTAGAARVFIGSLLNLGAVVDELARSEVDPVLLCSGREKQFALEDAAFAGLLATRLMEQRPGEWELNDGASRRRDHRPGLRDRRGALPTHGRRPEHQRRWPRRGSLLQRAGGRARRPPRASRAEHHAGERPGKYFLVTAAPRRDQSHPEAVRGSSAA
jgi:2-phosphosulfolactate phosphatase